MNAYWEHLQTLVAAGRPFVAVTLVDVMRVARRILSTTPTLVAYTPEKYAKLVPSHERLCAWFESINQTLNSIEPSESK